MRRLRKRLETERDPVTGDACPTCSGASSGLPGHVPAVRSEEPVSA